MFTIKTERSNAEMSADMTTFVKCDTFHKQTQQYWCNKDKNIRPETFEECTLSHLHYERQMWLCNMVSWLGAIAINKLNKIMQICYRWLKEKQKGCIIFWEITWFKAYDLKCVRVSTWKAIFDIKLLICILVYVSHILNKNLPHSKFHETVWFFFTFMWTFRI